MMLTVLGMNLAFFPAHTMELVFITVRILKMWQFSVLVLVPLVPTAALLALKVCFSYLLMHAVQVFSFSLL